MNAYNQAIRMNSNYIPGLLNRSLTNMKLFNFEEILKDCDTVINILSEENKKL